MVRLLFLDVVEYLVGFIVGLVKLLRDGVFRELGMKLNMKILG